jgi:hypothetical protein
VFKVISKVNCELTAKVDRSGVVTQHTLGSFQSVLIYVSAPSSSQIVNIKAKRLSGALCRQNPDNGWVEFQSFTVLPIRVGQLTNITATKVSPGIIRVDFNSEEDILTKHYNIMVSEDGITYKKVYVLFPDGIIGGKKYSILIKL